MSATAHKSDGSRPEWQFKPGQSGNPGGKPKWLTALQNEIGTRFAPKVLDALQALLAIGTDEGESGKVRVAALDVFIKHVKGAPRPPKDDEPEAHPANEAELVDKVIDSLAQRHPEKVRARLALVPVKSDPDAR